ncbi:RHS repeat-associated core domain-containing protein [Pseudoalteromonas sp. YIC-827]|uniref:RHS repeat-associated core domain-containing protein n=1 Tax=Pseudoalteromonas qingdaonensis TaxID=3131913 RepID=A0ABU9MXW3_9GAMM
MNYYIKFLILLSGLVCKLATADVTFVHSDLLGSPTAETNLSGKLITLSHYKPFGDELEQKRDDVGFTAHKYDTDLALNYMQARYYDPVIGRFYSNDPVGTLEHLGGTGGIHGFNRYAYANNNPYKYTDPDGRNPVAGAAVGCAATGPACPVGAVVGGVIGATLGVLGVIAYNEMSDDSDSEGEEPKKKEKAKDRRKRQKQEARDKKFGEAGEPVSEDYVKWKAKEKEKTDGKQGRRDSHDKKRRGEPDRTKDQIDEDYQ